MRWSKRSHYQLLVDTQGLVWHAKAHPAGLPDRTAVPLVLHGHRPGPAADRVRPARSGLLWRKDYEGLCETSEALIYATMTRLTARRLAR